MAEFPKMLYRDAADRTPGVDVVTVRGVGCFAYRTAKDAEALKAATQDGWCETMDEALGEKPAPKKRGRPPKAKTDDAE